MILLNGPNESELAVIRSDLGEDSDRFKNNVQLLQAWMLCQNHLPQDYENNILPIFLRGCKHNLDRAKKKIEMYFVLRAQIPELFFGRDPTIPLMRETTKIVKIAPLVKLTPEGHRVTIFKVMHSERDDWSINAVLRYAFMIGDIRVAEDVLPWEGDVFVFDLKHVKASHLIKYISPLTKKAIMCAHLAYPHRLQQVHILNLPPIGNKALGITKLLLPEKIRNRFISHDAVSGLSNYLPRDILPIEYGGTSRKFDEIVDDWTHNLIMHKEWFQQQDNLKILGPIPQHIPNCRYDDAIGWGLEGSFRKLEID